MDPHENEASDRHIEWFALWNFENIRSDEFHITQAGFRHAIACAGNRARVAFDSYDFSGGTDQPRRQQSHVSNSRSDIQHALTWTNPSLTKEWSVKGAKR